MRRRAAAKDAAEGAQPPPAARKAMSLRDRPVHVDELDEPRGGGVQSIGRAFSILEEIARSRDGISLAELSKRVGLHNSTTFHLVKTMVSLGYIRQIKESKRYRIGRPLFALAASALDEMEMVSMATPVLDDLSRETGESSHFASRMSDAVVVMARTPGPGAFQLTDRVGVVRPAYCTALGKVILAALRPDQLDRYLDRIELKALTSKTITSPQRLRRSCKMSAARELPSTTVNSTTKCDVRRCRCTISAVRSSVPSEFPGRSGGCRSRPCRTRREI